MTELRECPFCGGIAHVHPIYILNRYNRRWNVRCDNAKCIAGVVVRHFDTEQEAINAWNTRYEPTCTLDEVYEDIGSTVIGEYRCDHCGQKYEGFRHPYCPNCGAKVVD